MDIDGRFWLKRQGYTFVGPGRIQLLERIRDSGSINEAAKSMKMSYKAAWDMVDTMNRVAARPVVVRIKGGRSGGGTQLTEYGQTLIDSFRNMEQEHRDFLNALNTKYAIALI